MPTTSPLTLSQQVFRTLAGQDLPHWPQVAANLQTRQLGAQEWVFHQDESHPYLYVIVSGCVKLMYVQEDGKEWIKSFASEGQVFASMAALTAQGKTSFAVQAISPVVLERIPYAILLSLAQQELAWATALRQGFQAFAARKEKRERELLTLTPEQRYQAIAREEPALIRRISQKDLASYVGVTPVGLNRIIRRQIADVP
ncbi:Crp/Fnr family transcriptional regulator [Undibacterium sp. Di27W]